LKNSDAVALAQAKAYNVALATKYSIPFSGPESENVGHPCYV